MATKYSDYLVTLYTVFFYSYLVPIASLIMLILFFLQFWVDKVTLLRRSSLKFHFDQKLSNKIYRFFECSILALALGNMVFSLYLYDQSFSLLNLISLSIAAVFVLCVLVAPKKL
jgi:hypothetical protein